MADVTVPAAHTWLARWRDVLFSLAIGALLVTVLTYPTVPHATTVGRLDTSDGRYSIWNIAWLDHAMLTSPKNLLNGNIFSPHTGTVAYSELNLVGGLFGLPWYAITGSPLAALNGAAATALLAAFVCMAALVRRLTGSAGAGIVSATAFTFCPYVTAHTAHIQLLMTFVFPLVLLAFHALAARPSARTGVGLGLALGVAALASGYYGIFAGLALGLVALAWGTRGVKRYALALAVAAGTAVAAIAPVFVVFERARAASGASPTPHYGDISGWSANLASYAASSAVAHVWWLPALRRWQMWNEVAFPGAGLLLLAAIAVGSSVRSALPSSTPAASRRAVWVYLALAVIAAWASFGPRAGLWSVLSWLPGMSFLRAPARLGVVVTFALAVLAGVGAARVAHGRRWIFAALTIAIAAELGVRTDWGWPSWPLHVTQPVSPAYQWLAKAPSGVVVEFPFPYVETNYHNHTTAMYWSTYHWQPLVNGYSDVTPPDFDRIALPINAFPDQASFAIMRDRHVRYVLWHVDYYRNGGQQTIDDRLGRYASDLRVVMRTDDIWLYEIVGWPDTTR